MTHGINTLLIHGSGASSAAWVDLPARLPGTAAIDLPGHPEGEALPSVDAYAAWVREAYGGGPHRLLLVGHSLGGAIALSYALTRPEDLAGIVLVGSGARLRVMPAILDGLADPTTADAVLQQFLARMHRRIEPGLAADLTEEFAAIGASVLLNDLRACDRFDVMDRLGDLRVPLLAICGEDDEMTPPKYARHLAEQVPDGQVIIVPEATHLLPAENPAALGEAIGEFIDRLISGAGPSTRRS